MKTSALEYLACPECQRAPVLESHEIQDNEVISGTLSCSCGAVFEISRGIPRFCPAMGGQQNTAEDYGLLWTKLLDSVQDDGAVYGITRDDWKEYFQKSLGLSLHDMHGKRILDAGCGSGKLARALADCGSEIVSLDIHTGLDALYTLAGKLAGMHIVQGDAKRPPICREKFDVVWSSGMIHRTPNPKEVFDQLADLVAEDGLLFIWVSRTRKNPYRMLRSLLPFAHKFSPKLMFLVSSLLAVPLYVVFNGWYVFGKVFNGTRFLGFEQSRNRHRSFREIALTVFDVVGPRYLHDFREEEVIRWFEEGGFQNLRSTDCVDLGVCGCRKVAE